MKLHRHRKQVIQKHSRKAGLPPGSLSVNDHPSRKAQIHLIQYNELNCTEKVAPSIDECLPKHDHNLVSWINVDTAGDTELLKQIGNSFAIHPLVLEDILNTDQRPKLEDYGHYLYIVIKMITFEENMVNAEQVSIILGPNYVISFQEQGKPGDVFDPIRKRINQGSEKIRKLGSDYLAYSLVDTIVDNYFVVLEKLSEQTELIEEQLIQDPPSQLIHDIHHLRREMIYLRRSVWPLREVINALQRHEVLTAMRRENGQLISDATRLYLRDVYDHTVHVIDTVETLRDLLTGMLDIYLSTVSYKMNEIMKLLTIISTVFIPLTFIVGVYGMNFDYLPELHWQWTYPVLWIFMIALAFMMLVYFRQKKWI